MNNFSGRVFLYFHISGKGTSGTTWARFWGSKSGWRHIGPHSFLSAPAQEPRLYRDIYQLYIYIYIMTTPDRPPMVAVMLVGCLSDNWVPV